MNICIYRERDVYIYIYSGRPHGSLILLGMEHAGDLFIDR